MQVGQLLLVVEDTFGVFRLEKLEIPLDAQKFLLAFGNIGRVGYALGFEEQIVGTGIFLPLGLDVSHIPQYLDFERYGVDLSGQTDGLGVFLDGNSLVPF